MTQKEQNITYLSKLNLMFGRLLEKSILKRYLAKKSLLNFTIFQSLKSINITLWNDILNSGNYFLLDKNYYKDKKYTKEQIELINSTYSDLYDDYFLKLNNPYAKNKLKETQEKVALSAKIMIITDCANSLLTIKRNYSKLSNALEKENQIYNVIKTISKNVRFKEFNSIDENINIIYKILKSSELEFKRKYGENEIVQEQKEYTFEKQLVDIEQVLGRSIDVDKVNVLKWIEYLNLATEISKKREENGRRKK